MLKWTTQSKFSKKSNKPTDGSWNYVTSNNALKVIYETAICLLNIISSLNSFGICCSTTKVFFCLTMQGKI